MTASEITQYLESLNDELARLHSKGEICLYGGAVMCLVYDARPNTKDVDAVFQPVDRIRIAIDNIAKQHDLRSDWLNDAVKGYVVDHIQRIYMDLPALKVYVPEPDYLLAMKTLASRVDAADRDDIVFLIRLLKLKDASEVFDILEKYYPRKQIKPATQFFVEEIFEEYADDQSN